ncbi:MAG: hypothetical protein J6T08_01580 [Lentisphaeria bacterium]|nr:hypothetical protein [Lentisphaeria bacterium]
MQQDLQSKLAIKKLRTYLKRAQRVVDHAREENPLLPPCSANALELKVLKMWINDGIAEIKTNGIESWLKSV